ncbi:hypothetical protein DPSP01_004749 [Paraphaeosphaeria sporulosa]|uniref:Uncharacterized protein n=1 Tax=Paraphaeosphaeria sporulosa TaxID=1460663 RepID=A0A177CN67_9PLEO|nr:uncharacterized protein CC84DRAFT_598384 [Paraphaeosphaeria sporulosa]OAG08953.1 hypothetical protein CC84DRAFT_598384 [Paraphaeosphaeria sporulosa]
MAGSVAPPPNARDLLPPLLACLATANASRQPPPALLPLLSPILRQRVQLLASEDWLSLLCWDKEVASRLPEVVRNLHVEPHPASGEIEVEDPDQILYRRSDAETLHAKLVLGEYGIVPTYLWCTSGEQGDRWELSDLRGIQDMDDGTEWFPSMSEAADAGFRRKSSNTNGATAHPKAYLQPEPEPQQQNDDDDGSYWAAYDQTPGGPTPNKQSPAPPTNARVQIGPTQTELEYFARYASEVQPAMDPHDPDEEAAGLGDSTLNGNSFGFAQQSIPEPTRRLSDTANGVDRTNGDRRDSPHDKPEHIESVGDNRFQDLNHPRPASSASSTSVEKLEREAQNHSQAELAIKQHISTDMKSLFRLARASGIEREEFERIIRRELEVLPLLEQDE